MIDIDSIQSAELSDHLAAIRAECESIERHERASTAHAIECGKHLQAVKAMLPHGDWTKWVNDNVPIALTTVQSYIRLASLDDSDAQRVAHLPLRKALGVIAKPRAVQVAQPLVAVDTLVAIHADAEVLTPAMQQEERRKRADADAQTVLRLLNGINRSQLTHPDWFAEDLKRHARRFAAPTRKAKTDASVASLAIMDTRMAEKIRAVREKALRAVREKARAQV